ncbi:hypothetical protein EV385_1899 [Krasilnikovia cinnamomea]|uniref:Flavin reductase n=1 Tax=Krasilnikovia cinnamomea TaxID=349313 RepID=A0A4Q7ZI59_9ACTN|nr:hypothetical protein [Krasilnikovia cinnamomea]RZU50134.1 hypothetical protein EV385_1899 [Krasilnikovia cinnamomea]
MQHRHGRAGTEALVKPSIHPPAPRCEHLPGRPGWDCLACGRPWPCDPAREALAAEYAGHSPSLAVYLSAQHGQALEDLVAQTGEMPRDLHERFLGWVRAAVPQQRQRPATGMV